MVAIEASPIAIIETSLPTTLASLRKSSEAMGPELLHDDRFKTAAHSENLIVISPYLETPHLLDLSTLELQEQLLAIALTSLKSIREDYATAPYMEIFNWAEIIANLQQLCGTNQQDWKRQMFYIVVFRSQIPQTTDYSHLGVLDKAAHAEAMKSGGFLKYWFGSPDSCGRNLATCVWRTREDARIGGMGPAHRRAAGAARHMYTEWSIDRLGLLITDGVKNWEISKWVDDA